MIIYLFMFGLFIVYPIYIFLKEYQYYKKSQYYNQTKTTFSILYTDIGKYGEFNIYKNLEKLSGYKKFLFNTYITKDDGTTSEIDVILIHNSGIYVFESKNYSGWIFGRESDIKWTQVLQAGAGTKKFKFLNPIIQNKGHIKALSKKSTTMKYLYTHI